MKIKDYIDKILLVGLIIIFIAIGYFNKQNNENIDNSHLITNVEDTAEETLEDKDETVKENLEDIQEVYVHVSGCVLNPGVYKLNSDSRVNDAINTAGGLCDNHDISSINLSAKIYDEMKIHVYQIGEEIKETQIESASDISSNNEKINLNTASINELMSLTGIGQKKAEEIIEYRSNNKFQNIEELKNISGIGDKTFEKLKDKITVN